MPGNCFVCLKSSRRKVCLTCECYAHDKCWGEYLQNSTETVTLVEDGAVGVYAPYTSQCPCCRGDISDVKPVTRSDTELGRDITVLIGYISFVSVADEMGDPQQKFSYCKRMFNFFVKHYKTLIRKNPTIRDIFSERLQILFSNGWDLANIYHHQLFGEQLIPLSSRPPDTQEFANQM